MAVAGLGVAGAPAAPATVEPVDWGEEGVGAPLGPAEAPPLTGGSAPDGGGGLDVSEDADTGTVTVPPGSDGAVAVVSVLPWCAASPMPELPSVHARVSSKAANQAP
jgi:hypothetical protein